VTEPGVYLREYLCEWPESKIETDHRIGDKYQAALYDFQRNSSCPPDVVIFGWKSFRQFEAMFRSVLGQHGEDIVITADLVGGPIRLPVFVSDHIDFGIQFARKSNLKDYGFSKDEQLRGAKTYIKDAAVNAVKRGLSPKEVRKIIDEVFVSELLGT
jgi:hypothetical protein